MAKLRQEDGITRYAAALRSASAKDPLAVARFVIDNALAEVEAGDRQTLVWPAFVASAVGDRDRLLVAPAIELGLGLRFVGHGIGGAPGGERGRQDDLDDSHPAGCCNARTARRRA